MRMQTAWFSKPGGRKVNEDYGAFETLPGGQCCWVVADGLGGHGGGDVASRIATQTVLQCFRDAPGIDAASLTAAIEAAQAALAERQEADLRLAAMRSTLVILVSDGRHALWGHVGDSRLYLFRGGRILFQTKDHSVPQSMVDAGEIGAEAIRHHEDRNRLLRAIGNAGALRPAIAANPVPLQNGDAWLLCTDGFWEYVNETEMGIGLAKSATAQQWLEELEAILRRRAPATHDNYTGMAIFIENA